MIRIFSYVLLCLLVTSKAMAQYDIKLTVKNLANKEVILAHYYEDKILVSDTARLDRNGVGYFKKSNKKLPSGMYLLFFNPGNIFDLIIGSDQNFSITTDTTDILNHIKFEGSEENEGFLEFQKFMKSQNIKSAQINEEFKKDPNREDENVKKAYGALYDDLEIEIRKFVNGLVKRYPGTSLATFANFTLSPKIPDFSKSVPTDTKDRDMEIRKLAYYYAKAHFWDYTDFTDSMLMRTPILKPKLDQYFQNMVPVHPDSLFQACDEILTKARPNKTMFRYLMNYCLVYTFDNKIMGMDEAFVKLGQKYYLSGTVDWLGEEQLKKITDEVIKRQYNLLGHKAIDLQLPTMDGQVTSIYETKAPYTVLLFWEPNCGHCKKTVPELKKEIYDRFSPHGLKVFAVQTDKPEKRKEWEDFVEKYDLYDFINVWDPHKQSNYWTIYNVFTTPVMYILDKDKKIIAKNLAIDQMVDMLKHEYKKQGIEIN